MSSSLVRLESLWVKLSARERLICLLDCKRQNHRLDRQRDRQNRTGLIQRGEKYFIFYSTSGGKEDILFFFNHNYFFVCVSQL